MESSSFPARPTKGSPRRRSSSAPGGLADQHPIRVHVAHAENGLCPAFVQLAQAASGHLALQRLPIKGNPTFLPGGDYAGIRRSRGDRFEICPLRLLRILSSAPRLPLPVHLNTEGVQVLVLSRRQPHTWG